MPTAGELERALFQLAPKELAMEWDNVGLLVGECGKEVHRVLVALDVTAGTAETGTLRFSASAFNTPEEAETVLRMMKKW